jgi:hypothetical protein
MKSELVLDRQENCDLNDQAAGLALHVHVLLVGYMG